MAGDRAHRSPRPGYPRGVSSVAQLVAELSASPEASYVRIVAHWLTIGTITEDDPGPSGSDLIDALAAAAVAHLALEARAAPPEWTNARRLDRFWHPGLDAFFANALVHAPLAFKSRGILIERDSLESV